MLADVGPRAALLAIVPLAKWGTDATAAGDREGPIMEGVSCDNASASAVTRPLAAFEEISLIIEFTSTHEDAVIPLCLGAARAYRH